MNKLFGFSLVLLVILSAGLVMAHEGGEEGHHGMISGFYGMGLFGWAFMILILIALILFIVWLINQLEKDSRRRRK